MDKKQIKEEKKTKPYLLKDLIFEYDIEFVLDLFKSYVAGMIVHKKKEYHENVDGRCKLVILYKLLSIFEDADALFDEDTRKGIIPYLENYYAKNQDVFEEMASSIFVSNAKEMSFGERLIYGMNEVLEMTKNKKNKEFKNGL